jgi:hypothetical protein
VATGEVYEEAARKMLEAAREGRPLRPVLKAHCPWIETQLRKTARSKFLLALWGRSVNVDEHAGTIIVEPPILELLGELAGFPLRGRIVHAGLEHTYGYLFSLIETPYGKKRDRWIRPDLDLGFGFEAPTLRDQPQVGTLLLNLTFALARIAFSDHAELMERLGMESQGVAPSVREHEFDVPRVRRLVEEFTLPDGRRRGTPIRLHTDLVDLPHQSEAGANTLLVYSVINGPRLGPQLITAFPVTSQHVGELTSPENHGENVPIRARYNAYVAGLSEQIVLGRRFLVE